MNDLNSRNLFVRNNEQEAVSLTDLKAMFEVSELKKKLADSDYKVIKNYENKEIGKEPEYDPVALHEYRQALRDRINKLEGGE